MLNSEDPWAMAIMLIARRPSAPKARPEMPGVPFMFSPMATTMATWGMTSTAAERS